MPVQVRQATQIEPACFLFLFNFDAENPRDLSCSDAATGIDPRRKTSSPSRRISNGKTPSEKTKSWYLPGRNCRILILAYMTTFGGRISINEYIFVSVYEMASKFYARCARRPLLKKNVVKLQKTLAYIFKSVHPYPWTPNTKSVFI